MDRRTGPTATSSTSARDPTARSTTSISGTRTRPAKRESARSGGSASSRTTSRPTWSRPLPSRRKGSAPLTVTLLERRHLGSRGRPALLSLDVRRRRGPRPKRTRSTPMRSNGRYTARLAVSDGTSTTLSPPHDDQRGHQARARDPHARPTASLFRAGDTISFSGDATDAEDGVLPASAFTWTIDFLHEGHVHPGLPADRRQGGDLRHSHQRSRLQRQHPIPDHPHRDRLRRPAGLPVDRGLPGEGQPDLRQRAERPEPEPGRDPAHHALRLRHPDRLHPHDRGSESDVGQNVYTFASWSDGGAQQHTIMVPAGPQSLRGHLRRQPDSAARRSGRRLPVRRRGGRHDRRHLRQQQHRHPGERARLDGRPVRERSRASAGPTTSISAIRRRCSSPGA